MTSAVVGDWMSTVDGNDATDTGVRIKKNKLSRVSIAHIIYIGKEQQFLPHQTVLPLLSYWYQHHKFGRDRGLPRGACVHDFG